MPIYSYRCESCGHQQDVLQKMSDPLLVTCPACGAATFRKQVTAAGFQLKGSGWYVTDFRNPAAKEAPKAAPGPDAGEGSARTDGASSDAKAPANAPAPATSESSAGSKADAAPAAPKAPPAPASGSS